MPTYDYLCEACGHKFEHFQSMTDTVLRKCPKCKKQKLRRLFGTGAAIVFKGSGFYTTDYRSDSYKKDASADSSESKSTSSDAKTGDTKSSDGKAAKSSDAAASTGTSDGAAAAKSAGKKKAKES